MKSGQMGTVHPKPVINRISMFSLLKSIASIQGDGVVSKTAVLLRLKEAAATLYPNNILTLTSVTSTREEAIRDGLVKMDGYSHFLTEDGKKKLNELYKADRF